MPLYQIIKIFINYFTVTIFMMASAQATLPLAEQISKIQNENVEENKLPQTSAIPDANKSPSQELVSSEKSETVVKKSKKVPSIKKTRKSSKKKTIPKIVGKKIIKKAQIKNIKPAKPIEIKPEPIVENSDLSIESTIKIEKTNSEDLIKQQNFIKSYFIDGEYLLEIEPKDNCLKLFNQDCFRSDKFFQEPYFHYTLITIFQQKIVAEQYFEGSEYDKKFIAINDGEYFLTTKNNNKILVVVKNGFVRELILVDGDIEKENKIFSKCQYADKLLAYHTLYKTNEIAQKKIFYSNKESFKNLIEGTIFYEKNHPQIFYTTAKIPNKEFKTIHNLNLCKTNDNLEAIEQDFTKTECARRYLCTMKTLEGYGSEGFSTREHNFSFFDLYKNNKMINLSPEQVEGLIDEVNKLSNDDKNILKKHCFADKNIDLIKCSKYEKCQDYLAINSCEVEYFFDNDFK
jgi:hypothetical protein